MALWNQKHLPAPPTNTYKSKTQDLDIVKLRNAFQDCIRHFKNQDLLLRETALLSRILYRMKMKFRSAKEFKSLEKINHSLNIYLNANMTRDLNNIFNLIPSKYKMETYLPTRNMLSYILVRIQGLVKLMERVYNTCQVAAREINTRMSIGHFWKNYVILFALVSRIYVLVKFNTKLLCELYGKLLPHSNKLENIGRIWLPEGYELPSDLREWLGVDWVYEEDFIDLTEDLALNSSVKILDFFNLVDDDDDDEVQFCDEYVLIDEEDRNIARDFRKLKPIEETLTRNRMRGFSINEEDIGEDITDIINLNETNMDKHEGISEKDKRKETFDVEDIGEEITSTEYNINDKIQIIMLDETSEFLSNIDKTTKPAKINDGLIKSPKKGMSKSPKRNTTPTKRIINETVINLADDTVLMDKTEVIVIPDTPFKKNGGDNSVIVLDDTFSKTSIFSKTENKLGLSEEISKTGKKKNKSKNKKDYLSSISKDLGSTMIEQNISTSITSMNINTFIDVNSSTSSTCFGGSEKSTKEKQNIEDKEKANGNNDESINKSKTCEKMSENRQIYPNINNILSILPDIGKAETEKDSLDKLDKIKSEENKNLSLGNTTEEKLQNNTEKYRSFRELSEEELLEMKKTRPSAYKACMKRNNRWRNRGDKGSVRDDTKSEKPYIRPLSKAEKKRNEIKQFEEERDRKEREEFNVLCEKIAGFLRGEPQPEPEPEPRRKKDKLLIKKEGEKEKEKFPINNNKPNVVSLKLVNDIPDRKNIQEEKDRPNDSIDNKNIKQIKLVPCLETPMKATLNVNALLGASTSGDTFDQTSHNISLNTSENFREEPKDSPSNISIEKMEHNKKRDKRRFKDFDMGGFQVENSKKPKFEVSSTSGNKELEKKSRNISKKEKSNEWKKEKLNGSSFIISTLNREENEEVRMKKIKKRNMEEGVSIDLPINKVNIRTQKKA